METIKHRIQNCFLCHLSSKGSLLPVTWFLLSTTGLPKPSLFGPFGSFFGQGTCRSWSGSTVVEWMATCLGVSVRLARGILAGLGWHMIALHLKMVYHPFMQEAVSWSAHIDIVCMNDLQLYECCLHTPRSGPPRPWSGPPPHSTHTQN